MSFFLLDHTKMSSRYFDPFLSAIALNSDAEASNAELIFTGDYSEERWLQLRASETRFHCSCEGFLVAGINRSDPLTYFLIRAGKDLGATRGRSRIRPSFLCRRTSWSSWVRLAIACALFISTSDSGMRWHISLRWRPAESWTCIRGGGLARPPPCSSD